MGKNIASRPPVLKENRKRVQIHRGVLVQLGLADLDAGEDILLLVVEAKHVVGIAERLVSFLLEPLIERTGLVLADDSHVERADNLPREDFHRRGCIRLNLRRLRSRGLGRMLEARRQASLDIIVQLDEELGVFLGDLGLIGKRDDPGEIVHFSLDADAKDQVFTGLSRLLGAVEDEDGLLGVFLDGASVRMTLVHRRPYGLAIGPGRRL